MSANVPGGRRQLLGALQAQRRAIFQERLGVYRGVVLERLMLRHGVADDLVIHVGNVHHMVELEAIGSQRPAQDVDKGECAKVADMCEIVHGRPAGVHADSVVAGRPKLLHLL